MLGTCVPFFFSNSGQQENGPFAVYIFETKKESVVIN
jgi:hypothetical protein